MNSHALKTGLKAETFSSVILGKVYIAKVTQSIRESKCVMYTYIMSESHVINISIKILREL